VSINSITIQHSHNKVFVSENGCAFKKFKVVTALMKRLRVLVLAFRGRIERIQQVLSVAGNASEQFAIGVITDNGKSCRTRSSVTQFCRLP